MTEAYSTATAVQDSGFYVTLDKERIEALMRAQQLKRWWVAEFSGVHKTTLRRWLSGKIEKVSRANARSLARLLEVELDTIVR